MFILNRSSVGAYEQLTISNKETGEYFSVIPDLGGMLYDLVFRFGNALIPILDTYTSEEDINENLSKNFKSIKLAPFPNRIKHGEFILNDKNYSINRNFVVENHAIHGTVYDKKFSLEKLETGADKAELVLVYEYDGGGDYPFAFQLRQIYTFTNEGLELKTIVQNSGNQPMPYGDGWHPYFSTGSSMDSVELQLPINEEYLVDDIMIPTLETKPYNHFQKFEPVNNHTFDTCFSLDRNTPINTLHYKDKNKKVHLCIEIPAKDYPFVQIYIPPHRNSIAIEPMTCIADAFNNKVGLIELQPAEQKEFTFSIKAVRNKCSVIF